MSQKEKLNLKIKKKTTRAKIQTTIKLPLKTKQKFIQKALAHH